MKSYLRHVWHGIASTAKGMVLTGRHFFTKPTTIQYPDPGEQTYFSPYERGLHEFEPEKCIVCFLCAKACPVDCIDIGDGGRAADGSKILTRYEIDYAKCLFCSLCIDPCPVDCIHMGQQYDLSSFERSEGGVRIDFTRGEGPWRTAKTSASPTSGLAPHLKARSRPSGGSAHAEGAH